MRVQLNRDPLFQAKESPVKGLKQKQIQRQRQLRLQRMNPVHQKKQPNIQVIDPLPRELKQYKNQTFFKKTHEHSKARENLKKYIIQQQKNLKCLRLQRIESEAMEVNPSPRSKGNMKIQFFKQKDEQKQGKEINIPKIQQLFKNQERQITLYHNSVLKGKLSKAIESLNVSVDKIKSYSFVGKSGSVNQSKKTTLNEKFPTIGTVQPQAQEDYEIDKIIEKKLQKSAKLREKLQKQKKEMLSQQAKQSTQAKNLNFFVSLPKKKKPTVTLKGIKSITFQDGQRKLRLTPASSLLFELNRLSTGRQKKQHQLSGLLKNSYQNRESILMEKSTFYDQQTPFKDLSPSSQFQLRQTMDKKLLKRLELSKEQVNNFTEFLKIIKEYHIVMNDTLLHILKEVRMTLLSGKVMKKSDLEFILTKAKNQQIQGYPNEEIISKLYDMMI